MGSGASQPPDAVQPVPSLSTPVYPYPVQQYYHQPLQPAAPAMPPTYHDYMSRQTPPPPRDQSPPPPPTQYSNYNTGAQQNPGWQSNPALLQSYGEQDYDLREMTWPMEQALPNHLTSPTVQTASANSQSYRDNNVPSCEMLLTDQDIREGEDFIAEMEQKRIEYDTTQTELLRQLQIAGATNGQDKEEITELLTILCQSHHFLYGGHEDELGIEFDPSDNADEDNYILEQIDTLSKRHHQELISSDRLCAVKLLESRGPSMSEQKLDSILEEHIKLRGYMRTRQTKDQVEAYYQVQTAIKENPTLYRANVTSTPKVSQSQIVAPQVNKAHHPIVRRLPPLSQAKLKKIGATRGRTVTVDADNHVVKKTNRGVPVIGSVFAPVVAPVKRTPRESDSDLEDGNASDLQDGKLRLKPKQLESASIWAQSSLRVESSQESSSDDEEIGQRYPVQSVKQMMPIKLETAAKISTPQPKQTGFMVVTANPKYIANVGFGPAETVPQPVAKPVSNNMPATRQKTDSSASEDEQSSDLNRTGVIAGLVSDRLSRFNTSESYKLVTKDTTANGTGQRAVGKYGRAEEDYDEDFEEDEDLVAHYQQTLGAGALSDDEESMTSSDRVQSVRSDESGNESEAQETDNSKLMMSAKLNNDLADAMWENKNDMNPQAFKALISMWQEKQQDIKENKDTDGEEEEEAQRSNGRVLWQKAKERLMYDAIQHAGMQTSSDEEEDDRNVADGWTQSTGGAVSSSMQTSLTRNQSASVQTEAMGVDAETLVDEFFSDEQEKKKIKKMDRQVAEQLFSGELSDEEIKALLARNRENIEKLRLERETKRLKSLEMLANKKNRKKNENGAEMDEETKERLEQVDEKVAKKLIKHRDQISEKDMKRLLNEARKQQEDIIRQRNIDRLKQDDQLRKKLLEKKRAKNRDNGDGNSSKTESLEDKFYKDIQARLASGDLSHDQFKALMEEHLAKLSGNSKPMSEIPERSESDMREAHAKKASSIVRRAHEKNQAIVDMRQRERNAARAELKQKRKMKREKTSMV